MTPADLAAVVLIYPYWNVNVIIAAMTSRATSVLIYPYWNVNEVDFPLR